MISAEHFERMKDNHGRNIGASNIRDAVGVSDNIIFNSYDEAEKFMEQVLPEPIKYEIPADLLIAGTVPILNIQVTVRNFFVDSAIKDLTFRVIIEEDYRNRLIKADNDKERTILAGAIVLKITADDWIIFPLIMDTEKNYMYIWTSYTYYSETKDTKNYVDMPDKQIKAYSDIVDNAVFSLWYAVQIALLHPVTKMVFSAKGVEVSTKYKGKGKNRKQIVKYIKRHIVEMGNLPVSKTNRQFERKTLAWYVIGHYREYKDGKRIFVKPYWKGEMRELKKAVEQRERKIVTEDTNND